MKLLFLVLGTVSLLLGLIGIILPGLPTTPFLLLTAGLYMRGSKKFYNALISNKYLGGYIHRYRENKGVTKRGKINAIILQWLMIAVSCIWGIDNNIIRIVIIVAGMIGTYVLIYVVPTARGDV